MGDTLRASGEFMLRQTNHAMKLVNIAGGALKVKDAVKLPFNLMCRKQEG
jgi:hypothetical protein